MMLIKTPRERTCDDHFIPLLDVPSDFIICLNAQTTVGVVRLAISDAYAICCSPCIIASIRSESFPLRQPSIDEFHRATAN
jgi:hypothetical protein